MDQFGIDKIEITSPEFSVNNYKSGHWNKKIVCKVVPDGEKDHPSVFFDEKGQGTEAQRLYCNGKLAQYDVNHRGLLIKLNPSKIANPLHPHHLVSLGEDRFHNALEMVHDEMIDLGIKVNMDEMKPTRIDLAGQNQMEFPVFDYAPVFRALKMKWSKQQRQYEGGHSYRTKNREVMSYDKIKEMEYNGMDSFLQSGEKNLMRIEERFLTPDGVISVLKIDTLHRFLEYTHDELRGVYAGFLNKHIFSRKLLGDQLKLSFDDAVEVMKQYGWRKTKEILDIDVSWITGDGLQRFAEMMRMAGYNRSTVSRMKMEVQEMRGIKAQIDRKLGKVSISTMMAEVQEKFAA